MTTDKTTTSRAEDAAAETERKQALFIEKLSERGIVTRACEAAGIVRSTAYVWYEDPDFAERWRLALETATDLMEEEALRRAVDGVAKPVFQGGCRVGYIQEYSDGLLLQMLKANRPDKHRDRSSVELTGKGGGPIAIEQLSDEELRQRAAVILSRQGSATGAGEA